jgi:MFS family permease
MSTTTTVAPVRRTTDDTVVRWLPLAGAGFGIMQIAGNLVIDKFPDENTSPAALVRYYADHHSQVQRGGTILALSGVFLGLFVAGLVVRCRHHFGTAAVIAVGGAAMLAAEVASGSIYALLGTIGAEKGIDPTALQAWHIAGAEFGIGVATSAFLIGVAVAGIIAGAVPSWIGWSALVLAIGILVPPIGFLASMLALLWAVAAGVALAVRRPATD